MIGRLLVLAIAALPLLAQKKALTLENLYDPEKRVHFSGAMQNGFEWVDDRSFLWPRIDQNGRFVEWRVFDTATGKERPLFEPAKMQRALERAGAATDDARDAAAADSFTFDAAKRAVVVRIAGDLYVYNLGRGAATRLTNTPALEEEATFSPDGTRVAFVREHNVYVVDLAGRETQLTRDGNAQLLNGKLDYVYQEEIYGRDVWKGYWWSPDSSRIAFLQLDERPVPEFTIVDHIPYRLDLNVYDYPKAGDPNPRVKLFVAAADGSGLAEIDNARYSDFLIVNVAWAPGGRTLTYQVQNREQTWLELVTAGAAGGASRAIIRETTPAWVDPLGAPLWLPGGTFVWQSERSGYRHLYHYRADGSLIRQLTSGPWEVREVHGADGQHVYFSGTERSPIGSDVYRVRLDGSPPQRLSQQSGTHTAVFNPSATLYVDSWSDVYTPDQARVHHADGRIAHVVEENRAAALAAHDIPRPEFVQVKTRDGFVMEAMLIKPAYFDPSKKYPVYQPLYGGPHVQRVLNKWDTHAMRGLFHHLVALQGFVVWVCDNRTASGKGAVSAWPAYGNFGELELRDVEDGIAWLKQQPFVDGSRIALHGWSYGGFMVAYALTHSKTFAAGIAGAAVTDWLDYDSVYTERLMRAPASNAAGYRKSSPRFSAKDLHGRLLLIHGTTDDNVHAQNTLQLAYELQQLGKPFEMMLYPRTRHAVSDKRTRFHIQQTVLEFLRRAMP